MKFAQRMREAMTQQGISQTELAERTGLSKPAISQYLSGKYLPKEKTLILIAKALNIQVERLTGEIVDIVDTPDYFNVPVEVAARLMGVGPQFIRIGLQRGILPFGFALSTTPNHYRYYINPKKFEEYIGRKIELI